MARQNVGHVLAIIGGIFGLLAFFFMPFISLGLLSATAEQLASLGNQVSSYGGQGNQLQLFWLEPVVAVAVIALAIYGLSKNKSSIRISRGPAVIVLILGAVALVALMILYGQMAQAFSDQSSSSYSNSSSFSLTSLLGGGFWVFLIGMILVVIGGIVALIPTPTTQQPTFQPPTMQPPTLPRY